MGRAVLFGLLGGALAALLFILALSGSPAGLMLALLAPLGLFLPALSLGATGALTAFGSVVVTAIAVVGPAVAVVIVAAIGLPATMISLLAVRQTSKGDVSAEWFPVGHIATGTALVGAGLLVLSLLRLMDAPDGPEAAVRQFFDAAIAELAKDAGGHRPPVPTWTAAYFPAIVVVSWLLMLFLNAVLAQALLARFGRALRPSPDITAFRVPPALGALVVASSLVGLVLEGGIGYLGRNAAVVLGVPYVFSGLGAIHRLAQTLPRPSITLAVVYGLVVIYPKTVVALAAIGLLDQWLGLRERLRPKGPAEKE